jgi:hypothetical protein
LANVLPAVQFKRGVISRNAIRPEFVRRSEAVNHHPLCRQMGRRRKHLGRRLDVAGPQVMPEQAGDVGSGRRVAKGRGKLRPRKDRVIRQKTGRPLLTGRHSVIDHASEWVIFFLLTLPPEAPSV